MTVSLPLPVLSSERIAGVLNTNCFWGKAIECGSEAGRTEWHLALRMWDADSFPLSTGATSIRVSR